MDPADEDEAADVAPLVLQLRQAAEEGDVAQVGALLDQGVDIEARDANSFNALDRASENGHVEVVALLLDRGADVNAVDDWTPIFHASVEGCLDVVELLHARGADINHVDEEGATALHYAAWSDCLPICEFLLSKGADLMAAANDGRTALSHYGLRAYPRLSPETKTLRSAALEAAHSKFLLASLRSTIEAQRSQLAVVKRVADSTATLLFSDAFSDLVFVCPGGERIHAHRNIVSACSPHACVLLQGPWAENADERVAVVQMPQSAPAVRALLRFLYTGEVDAAAVETSMSDVLDLASQHEQLVLKAACERHAIAALSVTMVVPILVTAHLYDLAALKAACVAFIKGAPLPVTMSTAYIRLKTTHQLLWRELRTTLDLPEEEDEKEELEGEDENQDHKRARHDT